MVLKLKTINCLDLHYVNMTVSLGKIELMTEHSSIANEKAEVARSLS